MAESVSDDMEPFGWTPLMYAASIGNLETVKNLVEEKSSNINTVDKFQQTALHIVASTSACSQTEDSEGKFITEILLEHGAKMDLEDQEGMTALLRSIEAQNLPVAHALVEHGSCIHCCDYNSRTALHIAAKNCDIDTLKWLTKIGCELVNTRDANNQTPLMICLQQRKPPHTIFQAISMLLESGSNVSIQDIQGNTALLHGLNNPASVKYRHIELLLISGSDAGMHNKSGLTPVWQAIYDGLHYPDRMKVIQLLLRENTYLNMSSRGSLLFTSGSENIYCYENFMLPIEVALDSGYYDAARMLLLAGCTIPGELRQETRATDVSPDLVWFQRFLDTPSGLQHQCRLLIRRVLNKSLASKVRKLPLPEKIKDYLLFNDLLS